MLKNKTYNPRKLARMLTDAVSFIYSKGLRAEFEEYCKVRNQQRRAANNLRKREC